MSTTPVGIRLTVSGHAQVINAFNTMAAHVAHYAGAIGALQGGLNGTLGAPSGPPMLLPSSTTN